MERDVSEPYDPLAANPAFYRSSLPGSKPPAQLPAIDPISPRAHPASGQTQGQTAPNGKIQLLQRELEATKGVMVENIKAMDERGDRLDHLNERAEQLSITSQNFKRSATDVRKRMWWKNMKWWICIGVFFVFLISGSVVGAIQHRQVAEIINPPPASSTSTKLAGMEPSGLDVLPYLDSPRVAPPGSGGVLPLDF